MDDKDVDIDFLHEEKVPRAKRYNVAFTPRRKGKASEPTKMAKGDRPLDPQGRKLSSSFKIFLTAWAFMENALFSGLRAGWSALVFILKRENIYGHVCNAGIASGIDLLAPEDPSFEQAARSSLLLSPATALANATSHLGRRSLAVGGAMDASYTSILENQSLIEEGVGMGLASLNETTQGNASFSGCDAQDAIFNQCFTVATATMAFSALMYGHLNYKYGIRTPRLLSALIFIGGAVCFAFVNEDIPWLIFPGLLLVSSGGMALYITNNQISYMFTVGSAAVVGLLCGALEASSFVQTLIKIAYEQGVSLKISYLILAALYSLTVISTLCFLPKDYITNAKSATLIEDTISAAGEAGHPGESYQPVTKSGLSDLKDGLDKTDVHTNQVKDGFGPVSNNSVAQNVDDETHQSSNDKTTLNNMSEKETPDNFRYSGTLNLQNTTDTSDPQKDQSHVWHLPGHKQPIIPQQMTHVFQNSMSMAPPINAKPPIPGGNELHPSQPASGPDFRHQSEDKFYTVDGKALMALADRQLEQTKGSREDITNSQSHGSFFSAGADVKEKTLWQCLFSRTFILYLFWASVVQIILSMCLGTFNPWLEFVTIKDEAEVSRNTDVLFYSMLGSPLLALSIGMGMDALNKGRGLSSKADNVRTMHTAVISLGVTSFLGVVVCAFFMTCARDVLVTTSIALVIFRTALYSCGTAFLRIMYSTHHFGILLGIMSVLAGGFGFLQYPLFLWVQARGQAWEEVFGFLGLLGLISLGEPIYLFWKSWQLVKVADRAVLTKQ